MLERNMPDSGTVIVFKILGVLANARHGGHALFVDEIAAALCLGRPRVEQYLTVLQRAGAVRAEADGAAAASYTLTRYGLERISWRARRDSNPRPAASEAATLSS
jgi:DNA-binding IclR family transcriptional regulator